MSSDESSRENTIQEPNSVIGYLLDQFAVSHIIKNIGDKTSWRITSELNNAIILFIFLLFTFYISKILSWDLLSAPMLILIVLLIFIITEFVGANTSYFKGLFFSEEKANYFLKNYTASKTKDIEKDLYTLNFSPRNIQTLLEIIQSPDNKIPSYIVDNILTYNSLSPENLDTLFSRTITVYELRRDLIIDLLIKYQNQVSPKNVDAVYEKYKNDPSLVKLLFITQIDSFHLIGNEPSDLQLRKYYDDFHNNMEIKSTKNKLINRIQMKSSVIRGILLLTLWPLFMISLIILGVVVFHLPESLWIVLFYVTCFISLGVIAILFKYLVNPYIQNLKEVSKQKLLNL
jgi:hypothetical protein